MRGEHLFTDAFLQEIGSDEPNLKKVKQHILAVYDAEHSTSFDFAGRFTQQEEAEIVRWLNRMLIENPKGQLLFFKKETVTLPFISPDLSSKVNRLAQFHCPICSGNTSFPIRVIPIRISAISKQAVARTPEKRRAFEKAIAHRLGDGNPPHIYQRGDKLCVHIVFVLGRRSRDKDLDNMSKALLDALKGVLFGDDLDIEHLSLLKVRWSGEEDYVVINVRKSAFSEHKDVLFNSMHHNWAGRPYLDLADFL